MKGLMMKKGFTLSEVLTVLMVLGIIATMTMPVLYNNITKEKNKTMLKKVYASYMINIEQTLNSTGTLCNSLSCLRAWGKSGATNEHNGVLANPNNFNQTICTNCIKKDSNLPEEMKNKDFTTYELPNNAYSAIYDYTSNCNEDINGDFNACGILIIDTNGTKGPNQPCSDRFGFYISNNPFSFRDAANNVALASTFLVPFGYNTAPNYSGDEYNCTARIIYNGWKL